MRKSHGYTAQLKGKNLLTFKFRTSLFLATTKHIAISINDTTLSFWLSTVTFLATELNVEMFSFTESQKMVWLLWILAEMKLGIFCPPSSDAPRRLIATGSGRTTLLTRLLNGTRSSWSALSFGMWRGLLSSPLSKVATRFCISFSSLFTLANLASLCVAVVFSACSIPHICFSDFVMATRSWLVKNHHSTAFFSCGCLQCHPSTWNQRW